MSKQPGMTNHNSNQNYELNYTVFACSRFFFIAKINITKLGKQ